MNATEFTVTLPDWAIGENNRLPSHIATLEERMETVIRFSRLNIEKETGGPFAAGVFERETGKLVVVGVNRVVVTCVSSAHAEVTTLSVAQKIIGTHDLGGPNMPAYQLVVNWRPCVMCMGATLWAGIRELVIAGSGPEMETITGFDEGPMHPDWEQELAQRGISVINNVLTDKALAVFRDFAASGKHVYNSRLGSS